VFVHGIFGDADGTWRYSSNVYWATLLLADDVFRDSDVYVAAYATPYFGNTMNVDEVVTNLNSRLVSDEVFSKHREVVFVCHSLGGLVVQRLLLTFRKYSAQVPFIYFFSTPETGAQVAKLASVFNADPLLRALLPGDENGYLQNLENEWKASQFHIRRLCAYEKKSYKGVIVVDRLSGTRNCDEPPIAINEDHLGIVKPSGADHDSYIALRNAFIENPISRNGAPSANGTKKKITSLGVHNLTETVVIPPNSSATFSSGPLSTKDKADLDRKQREADRARERLAADPDKLTLHDLYLTDFSSTENGSVNYGGFTLKNGETGSLTHVEYAIVRRLESATKFLSFYILPTAETSHVCASLADKYNVALGDWLEGRTDAIKTPGDSEQVTSQDLVFTKRIYIYHETYLSPEQIIDVRNAYKRQGITVILRSGDYLANRKLDAKVNRLEKRRRGSLDHPDGREADDSTQATGFILPPLVGPLKESAQGRMAHSFAKDANEWGARHRD
jgi:hypothetical protein